MHWILRYNACSTACVQRNVHVCVTAHTCTGGIWKIMVKVNQNDHQNFLKCTTFKGALRDLGIIFSTYVVIFHSKISYFDFLTWNTLIIASCVMPNRMLQKIKSIQLFTFSCHNFYQYAANICKSALQQSHAQSIGRQVNVFQLFIVSNWGLHDIIFEGQKYS